MGHLLAFSELVRRNGLTPELSRHWLIELPSDYVDCEPSEMGLGHARDSRKHQNLR